MRSRIYEEIRDKLLGTGLVKHIDLWNNQTERLESGSLFALPAVFVEFAPISWGRQARGQGRGDVQVVLHIITQSEPWQSSNKPVGDPLNYLEFLERLQTTIIGLSGEGFSALQPLSSETDHDYKELRHSIECYICQAVGGATLTETPKSTAPVQLVLHGGSKE